MSEIPQELVLGLALLNIFVSNMDSGIKISLSNLADINKLCDALHMLEERDDIQRHLVPSERWACANLMNFTNTKYKILHLDQGNPKNR